MLNKILLIQIVAIIILGTYLLSFETGAFFNTSDTSNSIEFSTGEWVPAETSMSITKDEAEFLTTENIEQNFANSHQVQFQTSSNQYLSFQFKLNLSEGFLNFGLPNFLVKLNSKVVYQEIVTNSEWKRVFINLSNHKSGDGNYKIEFISLKNFGELDNSLLEIKELSTAKYLAKENDQIKFEVSKPNAKLFVKYQIDDGGVIVSNEVELHQPFEFPITQHFYNSQIEYYSVDSFGNIEDVKQLEIYTDFSPPEKIGEIDTFEEGDGELSLVFSSPLDNFSEFPAFYQVKNLDSNQFENFINHKQFADSSLPYSTHINENLLLSNLTLGSQLLTIDSIDSAGNHSEYSEIFQANIY